MGKKTLLAVTVIAIVVVITLINMTNPTAAGPLGVLAFFICTYIIALTIVTFGLYGSSRVVAKLSTSFLITRRPLLALSFRKAYYYASVAALGLVMLLGMQSVSGIGVYEFFLVCFFTIVGCLYVSRRMA